VLDRADAAAKPAQIGTGSSSDEYRNGIRAIKMPSPLRAGIPLVPISRA
jgi:hypothetical protein